MQHPIIKVVSQSVTLLPEEEVFILSYFIKQHHKKNEILMLEGEMAQHILSPLVTPSLPRLFHPLLYYRSVGRLYCT